MESLKTLASPIHADFKPVVENLKSPEGQEQIRNVKELTRLAEEGRGPYFSLNVDLYPLMMFSRTSNHGYSNCFGVGREEP